MKIRFICKIQQNFVTKIRQWYETRDLAPIVIRMFISRSWLECLSRVF